MITATAECSTDSTPAELNIIVLRSAHSFFNAHIIPDILVEVFKHLRAISSLYAAPKPKSVSTLRKLMLALSQRPQCRRWVQDLDLSGIRTAIPAFDLAQLFSLVTNLKRIDLSHCRELLDEHILLLSTQSSRRLASITLAGNRNITDVSLEIISSHLSTSLTMLCIDECPTVTNKSLQLVATRCANLRILKLASTSTNITDGGLLAFCASPQEALCCLTLRKLQLYDCPNITDLSLTVFSLTCRNLTAIELYRLPSVSDASIIALSKNTQLHSVCVGEMPLITDASICEMGRQCDIRSLTICHCESITDRGIVEFVRHSPNIRFLDIGLVGDISLVSLVATAQCCTMLQDLVVSGNLYSEKIPTRAVMDVVRTITSLDSLTIFQSRDITIEDLEDLVLACPNLRTIFVWQCSNISPAMADRFSKLHKTQLIV
eukprot:jgi/Hompol1/4141/HPOL_003492-RA